MDLPRLGGGAGPLRPPREESPPVRQPPALLLPIGGLVTVAVLPAGEGIALRQAWRHAFGANNFALGSYGWDMILPLVAASALCFVLFYRRGFFRLRFRPRVLAVNGCLVGLVAATLAFYPHLVLRCGAVVATLWLLGSSAGCLASAALIFLLPDEPFASARRQSTRLTFAALGVAALTLSPLIQDVCWQAFSRATGILAFVLVRLTGTPVTVHINPYISLEHPYFVADVKRACSGLEGVTYFFFLYSLLRVLEGFRLRPLWELGLCVGGVLGVVALNGLRLALFFVAAVYAKRWISQRVSYELFVGAFHSNLGWCLYLAGLLLLFRTVFSLRPRAVFDDGGVL